MDHSMSDRQKEYKRVVAEVQDELLNSVPLFHCCQLGRDLCKRMHVCGHLNDSV